MRKSLSVSYDPNGLPDYLAQEAVRSALIAAGALDPTVKLVGQTGDPLVSVIMPVYNHGKFLKRAVDSVRSQTYRNFELIVVDDGSEDEGPEVALSLLTPLDKFVLHTVNMGAASAINTGKSVSKGDLITWISADNVMAPDWLEELVRSMSPQDGVVYSSYDRFYDNGKTVGPCGSPYDPSRLISDKNCYIGPSFLVRREVWEEAGDMRGKNACDYDHWLRIEEVCMRRALNIRYVDKILCHYYSGPDRSSIQRPGDNDAEHWRKEAIRRRREGAE